MGKKSGPHTAKRLVPVDLGRLKEPGLHPDGKGLYLKVTPTGSKSWVFRFQLEGRRRKMGLGPYPDISLAEARKQAEECRRALHDGRDPLEARNEGKAAQRQAEEARRIAEARKTTFRDCAKAYISAHSKAWRNAKHAYQWPATLQAYVFPVFGDLPVDAIDTALVMNALEPIWTKKPETASRVRGRIERVLDWAKVQKLRAGENPALWRGHLEQLLPPHGKFQKVKHHAALPYEQIGPFMDALLAEEVIAARALEFLILTATRTGEVIGARWDEFDLGGKIWTIPGERMKAGVTHRVPLSKAAASVIEVMKAVSENDYVFPGRNANAPLSSMAMLKLLGRMGRDDLTVHGFRSTFKDWAAEQTSFPNELSEMALAHTIESKVESAYRRGDLLERRREMMEAWAAFAYRPQGGNIIEGKFGSAA